VFGHCRSGATAQPGLCRPRTNADCVSERARADIAPPELRDRLWTSLTTNFKGFLEYQKKTTQVIPMVTLRPVS
jgi:hypothetical protein